MDKSLKELYEKMEKLIEMCEKAEEMCEKVEGNLEEHYQQIKFGEICSFIKKCFDAQKIKHPKFFRRSLEKVIELVKYIYNETLVVTEDVTIKDGCEVTTFTGSIDDEILFETSFKKTQESKEMEEKLKEKEQEIKTFLRDMLGI